MRFQSKILIITILVSILIPFNSFSQTDTIQTEESYLKYNQTDKNGKRQWLWINYTHIGVRCGWSYIKSIGYYRDDNKIGDWNYYTKDGFIEKKEYYYNDSTYLETKYYNNNQIKSEGTIEIKITNNFDTILAVNPENGNEQQIFVRIDDIIKKNDWKYYHKDGTVAKKVRL